MVAATKQDAGPLWSAYFATKDLAVRNALVEHYQPFVEYHARRLAACIPPGSLLDVADLVSAGTLGLMSAIAGFDPSAGVKFKTYAGRRVRGHMMDDLRDADPATRTVRHRAQRLHAAQAELRAELGREPSDEESADRIGLALSPEAFRTWVLQSILAGQRASLSAPLGANEFGGPHRLADTLVDPHQPDPRTLAEQRDAFEQLIRCVDRQVRHMLRRYFIDDWKMKRIGRELDLSESRVSQRMITALACIKSEETRDVAAIRTS